MKGGAPQRLRIALNATGLTNVYGGLLGTINISGGDALLATLDVGAVAGFGTAGVLVGNVNLSGDALLEFSAGQIATIASQSELTLDGEHAFVADMSTPTGNSALNGLTLNAGSLTLELGASLTTSGALMDTGSLNLEYGASLTSGGALTNTGYLQLDIGSNSGGSRLNVAGVLINSGSITIGDTGLQSASSITALGLANTGTVNIFGGSSIIATLDVTSAAGFGAAGALVGDVNLSGDALLEFASGQIATIAADSELTLDGNSTFVADKGSLTTNSALTGLASISGSLNLNIGASLTTSGALANSGSLSLDQNNSIGGSTLKVGSALANSGTIVVGNTSIVTASSITAAGLNNSGTIDIFGGLATLSSVDITAAAGFGATGVLTGNVNLAGDALLEFGGGEITTISGNGDLTLNGGKALIADSSALTSNSALTGLALISGALNLENGASLTTTTALTNNGSLGVGQDSFALGSNLKVGGVLTNDGTIDLGNSLAAVGSSISATGLVNNGTINLYGGSGVYGLLTTGSVTNDGAVNLNAEGETFAGAISGTGSFSLSSGSTLDFGSSAAMGETINFLGADELKLGAAVSFAGSITGFGAGDSLDATTLGAGTKFGFVENAAGTAGVLTLTDTSVVAHLALNGNYNNGDFSLVSDGGKGSLIKFV